MTPQRWQVVKELLQSALEHPTNQRTEYLHHACPDPSLRAEVESLLGAHERAGDFLEAGVDPQATSLSGRSVGVYMIVERIGAGGMGEVYRAVDSRLGRPVALKFLPAHFTSDRERVGRFQQEARATSALNHPNIMTIYDVGEMEGMQFIASEFIEGETLRERLRRGRMSMEEILSTVIQIGSALSAAHSAGVIHRDIKPENVMLRRDALVKVLDFGLAKLTEATAPESVSRLRTREGTMLGTPHYMAPEQVRGLSLDARADIWSLSVVLYELLTGRRPFEGETPPDVLAAILHNEPTTMSAAEAPQELRSIVAKALQKNRDSRHSSAAALISDLRQIEQKSGAHARTTPRKRLMWLGVAAAIGAAAITSAFVLVHRERPAPAVFAPVPTRSVAVLPFLNMSPGHEEDYLSDGMTEELINALAHVPGLKVVSRTSSFTFKGSKTDVREVAQKLNVGAVVEGSVRKSGNRLRVTAQLVNASDGYQLWSQTFDRELTDVFVIQEGIATAVANALQVQLGGRALVGQSTKDFEAYELYLKGRQSSTEFVTEKLSKAVSYFRAAIDRDPSFSNAWAGLADAYAVLDHASGVPPMKPAESYRLAEEAGKRALSLDANSAEAHTALGHIYLHLGANAEAGRHLRRAIELNPNSALTRVWFALFLMQIDRPAEAREQFLRAREADPLSFLVSSGGSENLLDSGDYEGAVEFAQHGVEIAPDRPRCHLHLASAYAYQNRFREAEEEVRRAETAPGRQLDSIATRRALFLALSGRKSEALAMLNRVEREDQQLSERNLALAYSAAGDFDKAAEWYEKSVRRSPNHARVNIRLPVHPAFDGFRSDPRYLKICRQLGIPPGRTSLQTPAPVHPETSTLSPSSLHHN